MKNDDIMIMATSMNSVYVITSTINLQRRRVAVGQEDLPPGAAPPPAIMAGVGWAGNGPKTQPNPLEGRATKRWFDANNDGNLQQ